MNDELPDFLSELQSVINRFSKENGSNTPDFILAQYLSDCLATFNKAVQSRENWYGRDPGARRSDIPKISPNDDYHVTPDGERIFIPRPKK